MAEHASALKALLWPRSIVLVGVSADPTIIRGRLLESIEESHFQGALHLVSRTQRAIRGRPCVTRVEDLPEDVDLAIITIPAPFVTDALRACAARGVRAAVIISSGFAEEVTGAGEARQRELADIAMGHGMALVGPNAEGFLNGFMPLSATFSPVMRRIDGPLIPEAVRARAIGITSQSGGIGFAFFDRGRPRQLPFGYVVSMGNEAGVEGLEVMDHLLDDHRIGVGLMFLEGFKTAARFEAVARKALVAGKPLVIAKMGRSVEGAAAAAAHTSSLAGSYRCYQAMFDHWGVQYGDDLEQTLDVAAGFAFTGHKLPAGPRVAVITPSGGAGIWLTDACAGAGLEVPELDARTRARFDALLPSYGSSRNPVDVTAQFIFNRGYAGAVEIAMGSPRVDAIMVASSLTRASAVEHDYDRLVQVVRDGDKPVFFWSYTLPDPGCVALLAAAGIACYTNLAGAARAMFCLARYRHTREQRLAEPLPAVAGQGRVPERFRGRSMLCEYEAAALLGEHGIPVPGALARSADEALSLARGVDGPVALKVQSPDIPHKSDAGGVALDLRGDDAVHTGYRQVLDGAARAVPDATVHGVLVQPMADDGTELILGLHRDPDFGLMMLAGAGGVWVEVMKDSVLAPVPRTDQQARAMLEDLACWPLLAGIRGQPAADVKALTHLMVALSALALSLDEAVHSVDLNPVRVHPEGRGVSVLDALVILHGAR